MLTGIYLLTVQYLTKIGGEVGIALTKSEHLVNKEAAANSMIYKVPASSSLEADGPKFTLDFNFSFWNGTYASDFAGLRLVFLPIIHRPFLSSHFAQRFQCTPINVGATPHRFSGRTIKPVLSLVTARSIHIT